MRFLMLDSGAFVLESQNWEGLGASRWKAKPRIVHVERSLILSVDGQGIER